MALRGKIVDRNGTLYVLCTDALTNEPKLIHRFWKLTGTRARDDGFDRPKAGDAVLYSSVFSHWIATCGTYGHHAGLVFTEKNASHVEEVSAPSPKVRRGVEVRWYEGRWEKLLKRGWVPA